jgi:hypothetical protein
MDLSEAMRAGLLSAVGKKVIVDYKTNNKKIAFARGILISVEGSKVCISGASRFWVIDFEVILVCRVTNGDKLDDEGSYLTEEVAP